MAVSAVLCKTERLYKSCLYQGHAGHATRCSQDMARTVGGCKRCFGCAGRVVDWHFCVAIRHKTIDSLQNSERMNKLSRDLPILAM